MVDNFTGIGNGKHTALAGCIQAEVGVSGNRLLPEMGLSEMISQCIELDYKTLAKYFLADLNSSEHEYPIFGNEDGLQGRNFHLKCPGGGSRWDFLRYNKKWWLSPIILVLLLVGAVIILGGTSAAPFIYTLF
jgi:hypothetical protein